MSGNLFGKLVHVAMQWGFWLNETSVNGSWKLDPSTGGPDAFYDAGVHAVDLMLRLLPRPTMVTAIGKRLRFRTSVDNVSALALCGDVTVELNASQSTKCPLDSLTLDFEDATIHIPHALSEKSFARMEVISQKETTTREFETVNLDGKEVEDFMAFLGGQSSVGNDSGSVSLGSHIAGHHRVVHNRADS